jgi:uncharacterized protein
MRTLLLVIAVCLFPAASTAAEVYESFPDRVFANDRYVIYSHGLIAEGTDAMPEHPEFGVYDLPAIRRALFEGGGFHLIAHQRPKNTDIRTYVDTLESWVRRLVAAGVAPDRITLVGFSRGAQLTAYASSRLRALGIGTVLMGVCSDGDMRGTPPVELGGPVLSIYETSDVVRSCSGLAERSRLASFEEIAISTGKKHGAFYQPRPEWVGPLRNWISKTNRSVKVHGPVTIPRSLLFPIRSTTLNRTYDVHVKLPPQYDEAEQASIRYPVLYLNDATYNFQVAAGITHLPMNAQTIENVIVVAIGYSHGDSGDDSRTRDYTPTENAAFRKQTGGARSYLQFIEWEIIPLIESQFRADPKRRAYAGHSLGGLFGAYVLLKKPQLFRHYILSSPSFWFDSHVIEKIEQAYADSHRDLDASVYVAIGGLEQPRTGKVRYDMVQDVLDFETRLASHRYPSLMLRAVVIDGANHETAFPTALMNGILWHFARDRSLAFGY